MSVLTHRATVRHNKYDKKKQFPSKAFRDDPRVPELEKRKAGQDLKGLNVHCMIGISFFVR